VNKNFTKPLKVGRVSSDIHIVQISVAVTRSPVTRKRVVHWWRCVGLAAIVISDVAAIALVKAAL
jgi:hypothetical protein